MSKQTNPLRAQCQRRGDSWGRCVNEATWGVYRWAHGHTDVNLDRPVAIFCGEHKPRLRSLMQGLRNVRLRLR